MLLKYNYLFLLLQKHISFCKLMVVKLVYNCLHCLQSDEKTLGIFKTQ